MNLRSRLHHTYWWLERKIVPQLRYSQYLYEDVLQTIVTPKTRWLDLGCGHQVLPQWRGEAEKLLVERARIVVGADTDLPSLKKHRTIRFRVAADIGRLPFASREFDLVTANMVVEHLKDPRSQFHEICRVLKPGGIFLFHTPNRMGYPTVAARLIPDWLKGKLIRILQARKEEDVFPTFYRANTQAIIRSLAAQTGFCVQHLKMVACSAECAVLPPLAVIELFWIRLLLTRRLASLRNGIIATLQKNAYGSTTQLEAVTECETMP